MDHKTAKQLLHKSVNHIFKKIILKNYKGFETIDKEKRILIDLNNIYREIKNNLDSIIDNIADRFIIIKKDILLKKLVLNIYSDNIKKCILKINKIITKAEIKAETKAETKVETKVETKAETDNNNMKYLINQIFECIFTNEIIYEINELSEIKKFNLFEYIVNNWKIFLIILLVIISLSYIKKAYNFIFKK